MSGMRNRGGRVVLCLVGILLSSGYAAAAIEAAAPPPENAALLYYQAALKSQTLGYPQDLDMTALDREPNAVLREYAKCGEVRQVIELFMAATKMEECNWGFSLSRPWPKTNMATFLAPHVSHWIVTEAWILAADGEYVSALEDALALRRFARHMGDDDYAMWAMSVFVDDRTMSIIHSVLDRMPSDTEALTWLERELARSSGPQWRPKQVLAKWGDMACAYMDPDFFCYWKDLRLGEIKDDDLRAEIRDLTEAEALSRARPFYMSFADPVVGILASEGTYETKWAKLDEVAGQLDVADPAMYMNLIVNHLPVAGDPAQRFYGEHVDHVARVHAIRTAIRIYLVKARTGQLPQALPKVFWLDPYSGKDFEYEITEGGFTLRCALATGYAMGHKRREFHFKVAEGGQKTG